MKQMSKTTFWKRTLSFCLAFVMTLSLFTGLIPIGENVIIAEAAPIEYKLISYHGTANQAAGTTLPSVGGHVTQRRAITGHEYVDAIFGTWGWASGSGAFNSVDYRMAFDGNGSLTSVGTYFDGYLGGHVGVEFKEPQIVSQIVYRARQDTARFNGAVLQGSNDGTNYTPLLTLTGSSTTANTTRNIENSELIAGTPYKYYRIMGSTQADMFNPQEIWLYTFADGTSIADIMSIPETMKNGEALLTSILGKSIAWSADKADMLNGNIIVARPLTSDLKLTAVVGDETIDFNVSVIGVLDDLSIPATLYEGYELPAQVDWEVAASNPEKANMLDGKVIVARPLNETLSLTAKLGGESKNFDVTVTGILNGIDIPAILTNGYELPTTSYGKTIGWNVKAGSDASMLDADRKTVLAKAMNAELTLEVQVVVNPAVVGPTREFTVTVTGILEGIILPVPIVTGYTLPVESFGRAITWTCDPPGLLVGGVITATEPTIVTLTAAYGADTRVFAAQSVILVPPKNITFNGTEWTWTATGSTTGQIAGGGNGPNAFQIGSENPRSRYFMYNNKEDAMKYFTLYPYGYGEDYEAMLQASPSDWYLNLNGVWKFRYDKAPRNRVWPGGRLPGDSANPQYSSETGANFIYASGAASSFPLGTYGFDTTESYVQRNDSANPAVTNKTGWDDISVPGSWQVNWDENGAFLYDRIIYVNQPLPWTSVYGNGNGGAGSGNNHGNVVPSAPEVTNAVGTYQRDITIPASWANKRVFLNFDGVDSCYVWVDGVAVGYTEDKFTHHEFDITDALVSRGSVTGTHTITVQVIRWATGSHFEGQDFIRLSGIFRNIYLIARNREDLWDFQVDTSPVSVANLNDGTPTDWTFSLKTALRDFGDHQKDTGASKTVHYELIDADGKVIAQGSGAGTYAMQTTPLGRDSYDGVFGGGVRWNADADNRTAIGTNVTEARISLAKPAELKATIPAADVHMWSTEHPYLYKLVIWVDNGADTEYTCIRVGMRYVDYSRGGAAGTTGFGGRLLVNGKRVTFYGTNYHELNPEYGFTFTMGHIRTDIDMMKRTNVNAIRMSHYPHDARIYDLADEYGLYIMDEANIETHWAGNGSTSNATNRAYTGPLVRDRQLNMLERTKNNTSVVAWSIGNECGWSTTSAGYLSHVVEKREADITQRGRGFIPGQSASGTSAAAHAVGGRPSHSEWGGGRELSQLRSNMYPAINGWSTNDGGGAPLVNCEYSHAMGNALGNFDSWAYVFESRNHDTGGFIWDWVDQSIRTPLVSGGQVVGSYLAFGGDWGESRSDGHFCANGVVLADRTEKPQTQEARRQYQMLKTSLKGQPTASSVEISVLNKFMTANANEFDMTWELTEDGKVIRSGNGVLDVGPVPYGMGASSTSANRYTRDKFTVEDFTINYDPITPKPGAEYFFSIQFRLREDHTPQDGPVTKGWADKGYIVAQDQHKLDTEDLKNTDIHNPPMSVAGMTVTGDTDSNNTGSVTITGPIVDGAPLFEYVFDKTNATGAEGGGRFTSMKYMGKEFMTSGPQPSFFRALNCTERGNGQTTNINNWQAAGPSRARGATPVTVSDDGNCVVITAPYTYSTRNVNNGSRTVYTIYPDGEIKVAQTYVFGAASGTIADLGSNMILSPGLDNLAYFGRGPTENYVDRRWASDVGCYYSTVADEFVHYRCTQHMSNHIDTRWLSLTDNDGFGVVVKAGDFRENNVFVGSAAAFNPNEIPRNADSLVEFYALYYPQSEFTTANRHPEHIFLSNRENKVGIGNPIHLNVNLASRGVGGDNAWGQDVHTLYQLNWANKTFNYNYSIMPVLDIKDFNVNDYSNELRDYRRNVRELLPVALAAGVPATNAAYVAADSLAADATEVDAANAYSALVKAMAATKPVINFATAFGKSAAPNASNVIKLEAPYGSNLASVELAFETAGTGTVVVSPAGPQDFSKGAVTYTLTDGGGATNSYTVIIGSAEKEYAAISAFSLLGTDALIASDVSGDTGVIVVDFTDKGAVDLSSVAPDYITVSGGTVAPDAQAKQDFSGKAYYTVTAIDGSKCEYTVIALTGAPANIYIATYNKAGAMIAIQQAGPGVDSQGLLNSAASAAAAAGNTVQVFVWDANYMPLTAAVTVVG